MTRNDISLLFTWESRGDKWSEAPPWWQIWTEDVILVGTELTRQFSSQSLHMFCVTITTDSYHLPLYQKVVRSLFGLVSFDVWFSICEDCLLSPSNLNIKYCQTLQRNLESLCLWCGCWQWTLWPQNCLDGHNIIFTRWRNDEILVTSGEIHH